MVLTPQMKRFLQPAVVVAIALVAFALALFITRAGGAWMISFMTVFIACGRSRT